MCDTIKWALELYWYQMINLFNTILSLVPFLCILILKKNKTLLLVWVKLPFSFPRLCSMLWPAAIIWGVLQTLHCYLSVNCSALCEWIFGKCPLMTLYVLPPALFKPHTSIWIYWHFYWLEVNRSGFGLSSWRSAERSNSTEGDIMWHETLQGSNTVKILIIAFFLMCVVCLYF